MGLGTQMLDVTGTMESISPDSLGRTLRSNWDLHHVKLGCFCTQFLSLDMFNHKPIISHISHLYIPLISHYIPSSLGKVSLWLHPAAAQHQPRWDATGLRLVVNVGNVQQKWWMCHSFLGLLWSASLFFRSSLDLKFWDEIHDICFF